MLDSAEDYFDKGKYLYQNYHYKESIIEFDYALNLNPQYTECLCYKADALTRLDRTEEAATIMQFPEIKDYNKSIYKKLAQEQEKLDCTNPRYANPIDARTYNEKGAALSKSQKYEEAVDCFKQAIKLKPTYIDAYFNISKTYNTMYTNCYLRINQYCDIAIKLVPKISTLDNANDLYVTAYFNKAQALYRLVHYAEAILYYDNCIEIKSNYIAAHACKIYTLVKLGYEKKAIETQYHALSHKLDLKLDVALEGYLKKIKVINTVSSDQPYKKIYECTCNECKKKNSKTSSDTEITNLLLESSIMHFIVTKSLFETNNPWCFFSAGYLLQLSLELFLKSYIQYYDGNFRKIHCLKGLINDLSALRTLKLKDSTLKYIEEINKFYNQRYKSQPIQSNEHQNWYNVVLDILFSISDDDMLYKNFLNLYLKNLSIYERFSVH
jgi:tetratricopeptide (TPR) repeat protein